MNWMMKLAMTGLIVLMGIVFLWQPLTAPFSGMTVTNDFILQTADGALDSKSLRGKALVVMFGYGNCEAACAERLRANLKPYDSLSAAERALVKPILISVDPERDTVASFATYARNIHPDLIGAVGKLEELNPVAQGFGATITKQPTPNPDGSYGVMHSPLIYLVDHQGSFVAVLTEHLSVDKAAQAIRSRLPSALPPK